MAAAAELCRHITATHLWNGVGLWGMQHLLHPAHLLPAPRVQRALAEELKATLAIVLGPGPG